MSDPELSDINRKVSDQITKALKSIETDGLRSLRGKVFRCSANCCDDKSASVEAVHSCLEECAAPMERIDQQINGELQDLQSRFNRCGMSCADSIKDQLNPDISDNFQSKSRKMFVECLGKCSDEIERILPQYIERIKQKVTQALF